MASIPTLRLSHPFPPTQLTPPQPKNSTRLHPPPARAAEPNQPETTSTTPSATDAKATDDFDARLSQVRLKYRSGTGKKAEQRRAKTRKKSSSPSAAAAATMMLPPVPLKEPTSGGAKVELGFAPYGERLNGKVAALGLAALLLVELGSGKGLLRYHAGPTVLIQVYTVAALAAVFVKFEKERISVWPEKVPTSAVETAALDAGEER